MVGVKEIAEKAGVSMITVSRVINSPEKVSLETKEKIQKIMKETGYVRNTIARNLVSKKSGIICVYVSEKMSMTDPFFLYFLVGISMELSKRNYSINIVNKIDRYQFCDGYIISGYDPKEDALAICKSMGKPIAMFADIDDNGVIAINTDNKECSRKIVNYLIKKGHRRIAMVFNDIKANYEEARISGYKAALLESGIKIDNSIIVSMGNDIDGGRLAAHWFDKLEDKPTAVFFITDIMAVGFISELSRLGYSIPSDVSVVGFDGLGNQLLSSPKITTVIQPVYEGAKLIADSIVDKIDDSGLPCVHLHLDGEIFEGESVNYIK